MSDTNWTSIAIAVVVLLIAVAIGATIFTSIDTQLADAQQETIDQGTAVYGNQTVVVSSDDCYETCAATTDSIDRRQRAILITLDKREVWTSGFRLTESVPGHSVDNAIDPLVENGLIIERNKPIGKEYRYVGPDGKYAGNFSQADLQVWIADQLDAYNGWYTLGEITSSMPADETEVANAIGKLKADGVIQQAQEGEGNWIVTYQTAYAHYSVNDGPYTGPDYNKLLGPIGVVLILVLVIGALQRFRKGGEQE